MLLMEALEATKQDFSGANRWAEHQQHMLVRLDQLCQILDDPEVPDGAFIQLSPRKPPSRLNLGTPARVVPAPLSTHGVDHSMRALRRSTEDDTKELKK